MYDSYPNIYHAARKYSQLTREAAAEALGVSYGSLKAYELDTITPNSQLVIDMAGLYCTPWLEVKHEHRHNPIFRKWYGEELVSFNNRAESAIAVSKEIESLDIKGMLYNIAGLGGSEEWKRATKKVLQTLLATLYGEEKEKATTGMVTNSKNPEGLRL